ncbi:hypothetical protein HYR99_18315 [Candidatus Poribacteria bacterium]|nr:hypothetical protein [Candidatus Poribacteria bacterium]
MPRINLRFQVSAHPDLLYQNKPLPVVRLVVDVRFRLPSGDFSEVYEAIVDTGAYIAVIPRRIWRHIEREVFDHQCLLRRGEGKQPMSGAGWLGNGDVCAVRP